MSVNRCPAVLASELRGIRMSRLLGTWSVAAEAGCDARFLFVFPFVSVVTTAGHPEAAERPCALGSASKNATSSWTSPFL